MTRRGQQYCSDDVQYPIVWKSFPSTGLSDSCVPAVHAGYFVPLAAPSPRKERKCGCQSQPCEENALMSAMFAVARTWDDVESLMYGDEPENFLLEDETAEALHWTKFPSARDVIAILRKDPETRILPGRPPKDGGSIVRVLDTRDGTQHLGCASSEEEVKFDAWFRQAPLDEALSTPFQLSHFQLSKFFAEGQFLEGFEEEVMGPWRAALDAAGFEYDRCLPYIFISGALDVGSFHHDVSHVIAWQIEGTKRFCGLRTPRTLHGPEQRRKHGQKVVPPEGLREQDVLAKTMKPGCVLFNQLLTPHWVQSPEAELAFSVNLSHGGLRRSNRGRGLCPNEAELVSLCARDPEVAVMFDIKKGWKRASPSVKDEAREAT
jgi:hypothetical protein